MRGPSVTRLPRAWDHRGRPQPARPERAPPDAARELVPRMETVLGQQEALAPLARPQQVLPGGVVAPSVAEKPAPDACLRQTIDPGAVASAQVAMARSAAWELAVELAEPPERWVQVPLAEPWSAVVLQPVSAKLLDVVAEPPVAVVPWDAVVLTEPLTAGPLGASVPLGPQAAGPLDASVPSGSLVPPASVPRPWDSVRLGRLDAVAATLATPKARSAPRTRMGVRPGALATRKRNRLPWEPRRSEHASATMRVRPRRQSEALHCPRRQRSHRRRPSNGL